MKLLHKILLATDFGQSSEQAMQMAIRLAKIFKSEILILHVIPAMELSKLNREMIENGVRKELKKIHDIISTQGIKVNDIGLSTGIPFIQIIQEAEKHNVNVIVMGNGDKKHSLSGLADPLGITAEKVMHKASKPVWIVKTEFGQEIKDILCPVDFSKPAERALNNAIHLARRMDAKLYILHVLPSLTDFYQHILGTPETKQTKNISHHEKQLNNFLSRFDFHGVTYEKIVEPGKVHRLILDTAKNLEIDLIVMGTAGESLNPKILMGTNTEHVIRELPCSIITVKSESVIQPMIDYQISDLEGHYTLGLEFLNNGMPQEATEQFRYCVEQDVLYAPAWEGLAAAYERLGDLESAQEYGQKAKSIREKLWQRRVETELRSKHEVVGSKKKF